MARWNIKGDTGEITQYLGSVYEEASEHSDDPFDEDEVICTITGVLVFGYLMERICIERAHEKIRLKGNHCNPCCVKRVANTMFSHIVESWD